MRLILLGAPGAGKGTQAVALAEHYRIAHVSSGEILRGHVGDGTDLGEQVAGYLAAGSLVPDDLVLAIIGRAVVEAIRSGGYLLDGFPRTLAQAQRAYELAARDDLTADAVVFLDVPDAVAEQRLSERAATSGRVDDASPDVIRHRLEVFHAETEPLLEFYRGRGLLVTVDATRAPADVAASVRGALEHRR